jgi:VIT1/CCC1 family predicted Fe2+/Mn2+ transporter
MPKLTEEQKRLARLRDRQLAARDPQTAQRKLHGGIARRHRQAAEPFSLGKMWSQIPHKFRDSFFGLVAGAFLLAILPAIWPSMWATKCGVASILALAAFGSIVGRAADTRDELKRLMK